MCSVIYCCVCHNHHHSLTSMMLPDPLSTQTIHTIHTWDVHRLANLSVVKMSWHDGHPPENLNTSPRSGMYQEDCCCCCTRWVYSHTYTHPGASAQWQCGPPLGDLPGMFMDRGPGSYSQCCVGITRSVRSPSSWPWKTSLTSTNKLRRGLEGVVSAVTLQHCPIITHTLNCAIPEGNTVKLKVRTEELRRWIHQCECNQLIS